MTYTFVWKEDITPDFKTGMPTSVVSFSNNNVNKLNKGDPFVMGTSLPADFWDFLESWGGTWMQEGINETQPTKCDLTLVSVTDGLYDWKRQLT
jgi:hypothetical protein